MSRPDRIINLKREPRRVRLKLADDHPYPEGIERPATRADCLPGGANEQRPCPWVACKYHLMLDVHANGNITLNFPEEQLETARETCALDVADRKGVTLTDIGSLVGVTRERIRQIQAVAVHQINRHCVEDGDLIDNPPPRRTAYVPVVRTSAPETPAAEPVATLEPAPHGERRCRRAGCSNTFPIFRNRRFCCPSCAAASERERRTARKGRPWATVADLEAHLARQPEQDRHVAVCESLPESGGTDPV